MKLYYAPGACSLATHITLREAGLSFDLERVDLGSKRTQSGEDFTKINPKGYVPLLKLDNGESLTESAVLLQYVADQKPESQLAPKLGSMERYHLMEWLNFISTELHKTLGALFNATITPECKQYQITRFGERCDFLTGELGNKPYLVGDQFTIADAYLFTILGWTDPLKVNMGKWPALIDYRQGIAARPQVAEAMKMEGLM